MNGIGALLAQLLRAVAVAGLLVSVAVGIGRLLFKALDRGPVAAPPASIPEAAGVGLGLVAYSVFALGAASALRPAPLAVMALLLALAAGLGWKKAPRDGPRPALTSARLRAAASLVWVLLGAVMGFCLLFALAPATATDELSYHLAVPQLYWRQHGFYHIPGNIFASYPLLTEMLYLVALVAADDIAARLVHLAIAALVLAAMARFARRHMAPDLSVAPALLIFFSLPTVFCNAYLAYNDLAFTLFCLLAVNAYADWQGCPNRGLLLRLGIFCGLAMATKYAGLLLAPLGVLGILIGCRRRGLGAGPAIGQVALFATVCLPVGLPFYVKNLLLTGNPLYPFFFELFGGRDWDATLNGYHLRFFQSLGMGRSLLDYLLLPVRVSFLARMHSIRFDGFIGPVFLLLPCLALARPLPRGLKIALAYTFFVSIFWAFSVQQLRYLMPVFPFWALALAWLLRPGPHRRWLKPAANLAVAGCILLNLAMIGQRFVRIRPDRFVFGIEDRRTYTARLVPVFKVLEWANTNLPDNARILFVYARNPGFLSRHAYYSDSLFESYTLERILDACDGPQKVRQALAQRGITHLLYDRQYVYGPPSSLSEGNRARFKDFEQCCLTILATDQGRYCLGQIAPPVAPF